MEKLYGLLMSYELLGAAVLVYLTLSLAKKTIPDFWNRPIPNRIISAVMPEVLGVGFFVLLHVTKLQNYNWWEITLGGLAAGYIAPKAFYLVRIVEQAIASFKLRGAPEPPVQEDLTAEDPKEGQKS